MTAVRFRPEVEERDLVDAVGSIAAAKAPPELLREAAAAAYRLDWWPALAESGLLGALVPPEAGGAGLGLDSVALAFEELGRRCAPGPLVETVVVAAALPASDAGAQVVAGTLVATVQTAAGEPVPFADSADLVAVWGDAGGRLVPREDVVLRPLRSMDAGRPLFVVEAASGRGLASFETEGMLEQGSLLTAALLVGLAEAVIAQTVTYTAGRRQFGKPIGSFQAVQHAVAEAHVSVELARGLVRQAAAASAGRAGALADPDPATLRSMARVCATRAARATAETSLQAHGAMGYSYEHELHHWLNRIWAIAPSWGDLDFHRRRIRERFTGLVD